MLKKNNQLPHKIIGVAVIKNEEGKILIDKRLPTGLMANLWEFPGGKIEERETVTECIKRELKEELGIDIKVEEHLITIKHNYIEFKLTLIVHLCHILKGKPQPLECAETRWVKVSDLTKFSFPEANVAIIKALEDSLFI
jgi:mutator protein MutT